MTETTDPKYTPPPAAPVAPVGSRIYMLQINHRHGTDVSLHATEAGRWQALANYARFWWRDNHGTWDPDLDEPDDEQDDEQAYLASIPTEPPDDDDVVTDTYFRAMQDCEYYEMDEITVQP